jgi:hypothetical protein
MPILGGGRCAESVRDRLIARLQPGYHPGMEDPSPSASGSFGSGVLDDDNQIKGFAFEVLRTHLIEQFGLPQFNEVFDTLPRRTREILDEADINEWYPEAEMRRVIHLVYDELAGRNDEKFVELMRAVALAGVNRFFRTVLGLASGKFVLRNIPSLWKRLRRGPASIRPEQLADGRVLLHYENFRYCRDPIYRLLSLANCQAVVLAATKKLPKSSLMRHTGTTMTLAFQLDE